MRHFRRCSLIALALDFNKSLDSNFSSGQIIRFSFFSCKEPFWFFLVSSQKSMAMLNGLLDCLNLANLLSLASPPSNVAPVYCPIFTMSFFSSSFSASWAIDATSTNDLFKLFCSKLPSAVILTGSIGFTSSTGLSSSSFSFFFFFFFFFSLTGSWDSSTAGFGSGSGDFDLRFSFFLFFDLTSNS